MSVQTKLKPASVPVAHVSETSIPLTDVTGNISHAIVHTSTSATRNPASAKIAVDMLRTGTNVRREGNLAMHVEKLVILLTFADQNHEQNLEQWLMWNLVTHPEYVHSVNYIDNKKPPMCEVQINGKAVEMMIDTGASVSLLDEKT